MTTRIRPSRKAAGVTIDHVFGAFDFDAAATDRADDDFVARSQTSVLENADGQRHLMLSGNLTHRFTILTISKVATASLTKVNVGTAFISWGRLPDEPRSAQLRETAYWGYGVCPDLLRVIAVVCATRCAA